MTSIKDIRDTEKIVPSTLDSEPSDASIYNIIEILEGKLDDRQIKAIKKIGHTIITTGLPLDEALLLARVGREEFEDWCRYLPEIKTYIKLKQTEYKFELLKVINGKIKDSGDTKLATWILEKNFSEDYDSSFKREMVKMNQNREDDVLDVVMAFVRRSNSKSVPVNPENGNAKEAVKTGDNVYSVEDILS